MECIKKKCIGRERERERNFFVLKISAIFFILVLFVLCVVPVIRHKNYARNFIDKMQPGDKAEIEELFKWLVCDHHFGYTLLGSKPISIAGYFTEVPTNNILLGRSTHFQIHPKWKAWLKYQQVFKANQFLFFDEPDPNFPGLRVITLINKKHFLLKVREQLPVFRAILGKGITPESLLKKTCNEGLFVALGQDECLYGILLGYGNKNAQVFKRKLSLAQFTDPIFREMPRQFTLKFPVAAKPYLSIEEEYRALGKQVDGFGERFSFSIFRLPEFAALKNDPETECLRRNYHAMRKKLVHDYSNKDFLEFTLTRLCS